MNLVVDANVFQAYFQKSVHGTLPLVTGDPNNLFGRILGGEDAISFDDSDFIKGEWERPVEREWFSKWFAKLLAQGNVRFVALSRCQFIGTLCAEGFPRSKDVRYIQAAIASKSAGSSVFLVTEDIDFFDPTKKASGMKTRHRIMKTGNTKITNYLRRKQDIEVVCIANV